MQIKEIIKISKDLNGLQTSLQKHSQRAELVLEKYGSAIDFAKTFSPDLQRRCAENIERTFAGDAPSIASLREAYSENQVRVWVLAQIENLNQFSGTQNKMNPQQMTMLSDIILTDYYYLKASELLLFFYQFKAGKYGELYGSVDPLRVSNALIEFANYRRSEVFRIESEVRKREQEQVEKDRLEKALTHEEWVEKKKKSIHG